MASTVRELAGKLLINISPANNLAAAGRSLSMIYAKSSRLFVRYPKFDAAGTFRNGILGETDRPYRANAYWPNT